MAHSNEAESAIRHLGVLYQVVRELVAITHQLAPEQTEAALRKFRLLAQAAELGTLEADDRLTDVHRRARDLLESGVAQSRDGSRLPD